MKEPFIGRALSLVAILGIVVWWGTRIVSGRPAEPKGSLPSPAVDASLAAQKGKATAVFAGGCFCSWQAYVRGICTHFSRNEL